MGLPGDEDVGNTFTSVGVGCGDGVIATGAAFEQAVSMNNPSKLLNRVNDIFFMRSIWTPSNLNTQDGSAGLIYI